MHGRLCKGTGACNILILADNCEVVSSVRPAIQQVGIHLKAAEIRNYLTGFVILLNLVGCF